MSKTSAIQHLPKQSLVIIREDYIKMIQRVDGFISDKKKHCPDIHCTSAILNVFEYWTDIKLNHKKQAEIHNNILEKGGETPTQDTDYWIYKSQEQLKEDDLLNTWGLSKVRKSLEWLVTTTIIETRTNPNHKWDRTKQYKLDVEFVNVLISELNNAIVGINGSTIITQRIEGTQNEQAIPKTITKTNKETKKALQDKSCADISPPQNTYTDKTLQDEIDWAWELLEKGGCIPQGEEEAKPMFEDHQWEHIVKNAMHMADSHLEDAQANEADVKPKLIPLVAQSERDKHTETIVQPTVTLQDADRILYGTPPIEDEKEANLNRIAEIEEAIKQPTPKQERDAQIVELIKAWDDGQQSDQLTTANLYANKTNRKVMGALVDKGYTVNSIKRFMTAKASPTFFVSISYLNSNILGWLKANPAPKPIEYFNPPPAEVASDEDIEKIVEQSKFVNDGIQQYLDAMKAKSKRPQTQEQS